MSGQATRNPPLLAGGDEGRGAVAGRAWIRDRFKPDAFERVLARYLRREVADDSIAEAFVAVWSY